ncbi:uncharacterized protein LOC134684839 [Mytilus trossulus]|uniref:uncharacterized protein LOC134684839 n=1 Tax=Mytilus trossulus TaxID=6551 RepID=UPI003004A776
MATSTSMCAVCDLQHQTSLATHWCIECEESLCAACTEHHNVLKATRHHKAIPISDYQLLPTDIKQYCDYHNEKYQLYCIKHESQICNKCLKDHGKCGEIHSLDEIVKDIKTSESFVNLEQSIDDLFDNIIQIRKEKESNIKSIQEQKKNKTARISNVKKKIIKHLEKLGQEFIKEFDQIELNHCDPLRLMVSSLQDKENKIFQMKSEVQDTKKYASNLQAFLRMKEIQAKTTEYEKHIQIASINHEVNIESSIDTKLRDILTIERFGSIEVINSPFTKLTLKRRENRQAQIPVKVPKALKVEFKRKLDTTCKYPSGCCVTKTGKLLLTNFDEHNGRVVAINAKDEVEYTIPFIARYNTFDVACLDDCTIAVSTGRSRKVHGVSIVDLTKKGVIKFIDLHFDPSGISYDGKSLICCVVGKDLHMISCADYSVTTVPNTATPWFSYVATHADKIFYTNPDKHTVTCCLYSGELIWKFKDEGVLDYPQGITVDNNGNVFVAGMDSCNVVVISPDGRQCNQILTTEDGLDRPTAIFLNKKREKLLVTSQLKFAYIYDVIF